jgi:hypothetical protein
LAGHLPENAENGYPDLRDSAPTEVLTEIVKGMDAKVEPIELSLWWLHAISRCQTYRNLVGHFAAKRYQNAEVYVFASESELDVRKVLGRTN